MSGLQRHIVVSEAFEVVALSLHTLARARAVEILYADHLEVRFSLPNGAVAGCFLGDEEETDVLVVDATGVEATRHLADRLRSTLDCAVDLVQP